MERFFQGTRVPVLKIEGNFSGLRAKPAHLVGHLPFGFERKVIEFGGFPQPFQLDERA